MGYQDGKSFLDVDFVYEGGELKSAAVRGSLGSNAAVSAEVEKIEIFGLKKAPTQVELTLRGAKHSLAVPKSREIGGGLYSAILKVQPMIDLTAAWSVKVQ